MQLKKLLISLLVIAVSIISVSPALARADYDEDIVRAFKKLKIKKVKTNIKLPEYASDNEIKAEIQAFLLKKKYFKKKLRNKSAVVLVTPKVDNETLKIKELYVYKNPEIFLYTYDKNTPRTVLADRAGVSKKIEDNVTLYAISSNKIAKQNQWKIKKIGKLTSNFALSTFTILPKLGLGYILNPPFNYLKTGTAPDIHKHLLKEVEMLMTDEKDYGKVLFIDKEVIVKVEPKVAPKKEIKLEPVKTQAIKEEEKTEEELLKELEAIKPLVDIKEEPKAQEPLVEIKKEAIPKIKEEPAVLESSKEEVKVEEPVIEIKEDIKTEPEVIEEPKATPVAQEMPEAEVGDKSDTKAEVKSETEE